MIFGTLFIHWIVLLTISGKALPTFTAVFHFIIIPILPCHPLFPVPPFASPDELCSWCTPPRALWLGIAWKHTRATFCFMSGKAAAARTAMQNSLTPSKRLNSFTIDFLKEGEVIQSERVL